MTKEDLRNEWAKKVVAYRESGQNQTVWCKANNVNLRTLSTWLRKDRVKTPEPIKEPPSTDLKDKSTNWLSMKLEKTFEKSKTSVISIKLGNAIIETNPGFDSEHLLKIVKTLNSLC